LTARRGSNNQVNNRLFLHQCSKQTLHTHTYLTHYVYVITGSLYGTTYAHVFDTLRLRYNW